MLNISRVRDRFGSEAAFVSAARDAVLGFSYDRRKKAGGEYEFVFPEYGTSLTQKAPRWSINSKSSSDVEPYEAPAAALMAFVVTAFGLRNVYDIGASDGKHALFIASMTGFQGMVYAFEMQPTRHRAMVELVAQNQTTGQRLRPQLAGLSDHHDGERTVWYNQNRLFESAAEAGAFRQAWWRLLKFWLKGEKHRLSVHETTVLLTSIDHFAARHDAQPDLLKIDVDGYEGPILKGALGAIAAHHPFILLELHRDELMARFNIRKHQVAELLFDQGYSAMWLTDHHHIANTALQPIERGDPTLSTDRTQMILFY